MRVQDNQGVGGAVDILIYQTTIPHPLSQTFYMCENACDLCELCELCELPTTVIAPSVIARPKAVAI
jgi:hypothetical protein